MHRCETVHSLAPSTCLRGQTRCMDSGRSVRGSVGAGNRTVATSTPEARPAHARATHAHKTALRTFIPNTAARVNVLCLAGSRRRRKQSNVSTMLVLTDENVYRLYIVPVVVNTGTLIAQRCACVLMKALAGMQGLCVLHPISSDLILVRWDVRVRFGTFLSISCASSRSWRAAALAGCAQRLTDISRQGVLVRGCCCRAAVSHVPPPLWGAKVTQPPPRPGWLPAAAQAGRAACVLNPRPHKDAKAGRHLCAQVVIPCWRMMESAGLNAGPVWPGVAELPALSQFNAPSRIPTQESPFSLLRCHSLTWLPTSASILDVK